ncbi:MAG: outer membrane beta-barrel protein [Candidatus Krumholzibacteria bacterium]|nr:outer membrane beta-barrel protein [Candidatus Krumholzibacteria bacterium]MDH4336047.1 outer membrane beta-barrel protein [Candidatus Krumholzibacteria bacterium]MDH5268377.1 outer membrane beta-barrel protein [Candidatus Krumholzibacteria bacterium]MDH5627580.1 outer membrane beta-barrel protein [Candidatus Krumholzibacteria bacterium]
MKRAFLVTLLLLAAVPAGVVQAQTTEPQYLRLPHRFQIFVEGGGALPTSPSIWDELWDSAFSFGLGAGASIFPWLEVNAGFNTMSFGLNHLQAKGLLGYQGIQEVEGGAISTSIYYGSARFIAVPRARTNPYLEAQVGYFSTSADDVIIEGVVDKSMESVSGMSVSGTVGIQYAMSDYWTAYAKYTYTANLNGDFAPGDLLQPVNGSRDEPKGNQIIQSLIVGVMVRF